MIRRLVVALLVPLALIAAEPTSLAPFGRIAIRAGSYFDTGTGKTFHPLGVNYFRIAPIRPSIMSEGATMSAPASAWEMAVLQSSSTEASLSMETIC